MPETTNQSAAKPICTDTNIRSGDTHITMAYISIRIGTAACPSPLVKAQWNQRLKRDQGILMQLSYHETQWNGGLT
jgi:hypothetical protein